jgi:hypothetical protein
MDHRGHPKNPLHREQLHLEQLSARFLEASAEEDPSLVKTLGALKADGLRELGGILGRLDARGKGELDAEERLLARRVLSRLHKPTADTLVLTNKVLDYLDFNMSALIEEDELELCVKIIEAFSRADSDNDTLSHRELEMLYAVLRHLDTNENGQLDPHERHALYDGLSSPKAFLEAQKFANPHLRALLASAR